MFKTWEELEESIKGCNKCKLCKTRQNIVFGTGNKHAKLMFIGEGPGAAAELFMILHIAAVGVEDGSGGLPHLPLRIVPAAVDLHAEIPQRDLFLRRIFCVPVIIGKAVVHAVNPELKLSDARRAGRYRHGGADQDFRIQPLRTVDRDAGGGKIPVVEQNARIG